MTSYLDRGFSMLFEETQEQEVAGHYAYCQGHRLEKPKQKS